MANALAYAHERGFVHCDFKPGNVILTDAGIVKVIDFGIARVFQKTEEDADATVFDPGSLGALTPAYASPEMLEQREPDPRDDIYALACITYELLTGRHPFNRLSSAQARGAGMKPQRPPNLGRPQWHALKCALALERGARTPTVTRFLAGFGARGLSRYRPAAATAAGVLAIGALAVAGGRYLGGEPEPPDPGQASPPVAQAPNVAPAVPPAVPPASPPASGPAPEPVAPPVPVPAAASVAAALARIPCSALAADVRAARVEVTGVVSKAVGAAGVRAPLQAMPGMPSINLDLREVDPGMCPVISTFGPYWVAHRQAGGGAGLRLAGAAAPSATLAAGDSLMVDVRTPAAASFMSVDAYSPDARVIHLLPNALALDNRAPPGHGATIGRPGDWTIGKSAGSGLLVVLVTTPAPLFGTLRRESEPSPDYLAEVARNLAQIRARSGPGAIGVEFLPVAVRGRRP